MTREREYLIADCKELLIRLERWIEIDKFIRHQNGYIEVEYVLCDILNLVYGWQLNNANDLFGRDQDSFDLSDEVNEIAVQVTVTDGAAKIRETLSKFIGKYDKDFKRLVFVYPKISPSESRADFVQLLDGFDFDATRDRVGLGKILSSAQASQLLPLRDLLRKELGSLASPAYEQHSSKVIIANTVIANQSILMQLPEEDHAKEDSPKLLLSAYARPLPDDVTSVPCYPSTSWASDTESTTLPLFYTSERRGEQIDIEPINPYVTTIHSGGPLHTLSTRDPWYGVFHFPTLDVKLINNTDKTVFFHEAEFRVATSKPDLSAVPAVIGPLGSLYISICNLGWGEMKNAVLRFALISIPEEELDRAAMQVPDHLPHMIELGTFDSAKTFTLLPYFEIEGVDTNRIAELLDIIHYESDESTVRFRKEYEFCFEPTEQDEDGRIFHARELPRAEYENFLKTASGRFYNSRPCLAGILEYDETSSDDRSFIVQCRYLLFSTLNATAASVRGLLLQTNIILNWRLMDMTTFVNFRYRRH